MKNSRAQIILIVLVIILHFYGCGSTSNKVVRIYGAPIKGDVIYYPSQIKLKIHPDTTYQGQMIMTKITLENNTDSIFTHVPGNSLFHVVENIATGGKI